MFSGNVAPTLSAVRVDKTCWESKKYCSKDVDIGVQGTLVNIRVYFLLDLKWEFSICIVQSTCTWDNNDRDISQVLYYHYAIVFRFIFKRFKLTPFLQETHLSEYRTGAPFHSASLPSWSWRPDTIGAPAWIHVPPEVAGRNLIDRFTLQPMANVYCLWALNRLNVSVSDILFQSCGISLHFFKFQEVISRSMCVHMKSALYRYHMHWFSTVQSLCKIHAGKRENIFSFSLVYQF